LPKLELVLRHKCSLVLHCSRNGTHAEVSAQNHGV